RSRILRTMLAELNKVKESVLKNPLVYRSEAAVLRHLGDIYLELGQIKEASACFDKAFAILSAEARDHPGDPVALRNLAAILNNLGDVQNRLGNLPKARERYAEGLRLRQQWAGALPQHDPARQAVAESHKLLGRADLLLGNPAAALADFQAALKEFETLR